ncbi:hypothetical protein [Seonamhaeicola marinus]|uniref:Uncharacterized protein n=1 Tax=Seonamhaeicola marinus TaxID=1912246 RepID=A0A5D0I6C4_9FLAO|nr:hypothetical protein [Seonamhaeicola marinus]TYA78431.1 hypothetical protein FUA24_08725 [Seonamhaeicola marinus]
MKFYSKSLKEFSSNMELYVPLSIIFQSCVGSIAAMYVLMNSKAASFLLELTLCVSVTMLYNAFIMAQIKKKWIFNLLLVSVLLNIFLIILNVNRL